MQQNDNKEFSKIQSLLKSWFKNKINKFKNSPKVFPKGKIKNCKQKKINYMKNLGGCELRVRTGKLPVVDGCQHQTF